MKKAILPLLIAFAIVGGGYLVACKAGICPCSPCHCSPCNCK